MGKIDKKIKLVKMTSRALSSLLSPFKLGDLTLPNRICMASLTRQRCDPDTAVPNDLHVEYYSARASAGIIFSECSQISDRSNCFAGSAGIYSEEQVQGWKRVTDAVHKKGGRIFLQIWHCGRAVHPLNINGRLPVAPSAVTSRPPIPVVLNGKLSFHTPVTPEPLTEEGIQEIIQQFRKGAENAQRAGFDGLELHGANGYICDQFLRDWTNRRTDKWGGPAENRIRFISEVLDQLIAVYGASRVGIKLSPTGRYNDLFDSNPLLTYSTLIKELNKKKIAFIQVMNTDNGSGIDPRDHLFVDPALQIPDTHRAFRPLFKGAFAANANLTPEAGNELIQKEVADLAVFGRLFIKYPNLVEKLEKGEPVDVKQKNTYWYGGGATGYTDLSVYQNQLPFFMQQKIPQVS
eukprot:TRINITY_DN2974_c0_g1_i1.p1 TRINITY_DN2974_c0_g1~~TRINITY_DN2974_c0_g1_i1.p1  ORF type:complete len:406 (-),score=82.16 TRINITY_DN2974_c0_g1_i1:143-1360(-)